MQQENWEFETHSLHLVLDSTGLSIVGTAGDEVEHFLLDPANRMWRARGGDRSLDSYRPQDTACYKYGLRIGTGGRILADYESSLVSGARFAPGSDWQAVRLEFLILSLNPGLRQRCVAPGVWPTTQRGAQPRVVEGPHAVDLRRRTHGGPCRVENTFFRDTSIIGDGLGARSPAGQGSEVVLGL